MFRSAALLIVLAFILGLWIGFNPEARARAAEAVKKADVALASFGERMKEDLTRLFSRVSQESPPPANPPIQPKPSNVLGQLQEAIRQIWEALVRFWNDLVNSRPTPAENH